MNNTADATFNFYILQTIYPYFFPNSKLRLGGNGTEVLCSAYTLCARNYDLFPTQESTLFSFLAIILVLRNWGLAAEHELDVHRFKALQWIIHSMGTLFFRAPGNAFIRKIVPEEDRKTAASLRQLSVSGMVLIGPGVATTLYTV